MHGEICIKRVLVFLVLFFHFILFFCKVEAKVSICDKNTNEVIHTINPNSVAADVISNNMVNYTIVSSDSCEDFKEPFLLTTVVLSGVETYLKRENFENLLETEWIILLPYVKGCDLEGIQRKAEDLGYSLLFLYGNDEYDGYPKGHGIPTFFFSHTDGTSLKENYSNSKRYFVRIGASIQWDYVLMNFCDICTALLSTSTQWLMSLLPFVMVICGKKLYKSFVRRIHRNDEYNQTLLEHRIHQYFMFHFLMENAFRERQRKYRVIQVPTVHWEPKSCKYNDTCGICLDTYSPEAELSLPPCNHYYHKECLDTWIAMGKHTCPLCRVPMVKDDGISSDEYFEFTDPLERLSRRRIGSEDLL